MGHLPSGPLPWMAILLNGLLRSGFETGMPVHRLVVTNGQFNVILAVLFATICFIKLQLNTLTIIADRISHLLV